MALILLSLIFVEIVVHIGDCNVGESRDNLGALDHLLSQAWTDFSVSIVVHVVQRFFCRKIDLFFGLD
jgi:hypothetical protein